MPDMINIPQENFEAAYPRFNDNRDYYEGRVEKAAGMYRKTFKDNASVRIFSAPGRTEIGGNHTDHQHGCVLAAAIDMDILAAAAENGTNVIRILSEGYKMVEIDIMNLKPVKEEENTSSAIIRGVAAGLAKEGYNIKGFNMYAVSSVLKGSGLSSSAAFEVIVGTVMNGLFCGGAVDSVKIAQIGQFAENVYFGKPSGLMDQMASSVGNIVAIDFKDTDNPVVKKIDFDFSKAGYALCIIDSGADHADLTPEYAAIPKEMKEVASYFGKEVLRETDINSVLENAADIRDKFGDRAFMRAVHFFDDNERALKEAEYLQNGNFDEFLTTIRQSGYSSYMYLQNVSVCGSDREQAVAYVLCLCHAFLKDKGAYRVHGGGFAGTVQAFVPSELVGSFKEKIEKAVGKGCCHVLSIRAMGGAELTSKK